MFNGGTRIGVVCHFVAGLQHCTQSVPVTLFDWWSMSFSLSNLSSYLHYTTSSHQYCSFQPEFFFSFRLLYVSGLVRRPSVTVTIATASVLFIWSNDVTRCDVTISLCKAKLYPVHYYSPGERPATSCRTLNQSRARSKPLREGDYTLIGDVRL